MKFLTGVFSGAGGEVLGPPLTFNSQIENSDLDSVRDAIDSGTTNGRLKIYDGSTLLIDLELSAQSFADKVGSESVLNPVPQTAVTDSGSPNFFRFTTSEDEFVFSGTVPANLDLGTSSVTTGQLLTIGNFTLTEGVVQESEFVSTIEYPYV